MKNEEKPTAPVTIHYDEQGNPDGIRICTLDEDFVVALHDEFNGKEVTFAKTKNLSLPNEKMFRLIGAYRNVVKQLLIEAGCDPIIGWYWSSTPAEELFGAYYVNLQLVCNGTTGALVSINARFSTSQVRVALALK